MIGSRGYKLGPTVKNVKSSYNNEDKSQDKFKCVLLLGPVFRNNSYSVGSYKIDLDA